MYIFQFSIIIFYSARYSLFISFVSTVYYAHGILSQRGANSSRPVASSSIPFFRISLVLTRIFVSSLQTTFQIFRNNLKSKQEKLSPSPDRGQFLQNNFRNFLTKITIFSWICTPAPFSSFNCEYDTLNGFVDFSKCDILLTSDWTKITDDNSGCRSAAFYPSTTQEYPRSSDPRHPVLDPPWTVHPTLLSWQTPAPSTAKPPSSPRRSTPAIPANHRVQTTTMPRI